MAKGNVAKKIETKTNLGELEKEVAIVKQLVGALVFNSYSNLESAESETPLSLSATTDLPLIEESIIHEVLEKKLSKKSEGKSMSIQPVRLVAIEEEEYVGFFQTLESYDVEDSTKDIEVPIYDYNDLWDLILQDYYQQLDVVYSLDLENKVVVDTQVTLF